MLKSMFSYVNMQNNLCEVLLDREEETAYVLDTTNLDVFKTNHVDGIYGLLEFVNNNVSYLHEIKMEQLETALRFLEDNDCTEDYQKMYKMLSGAWLDMKGER